MSKKIENFEIEINNLKNKLNEEEIKNSKLAFDNNILSNKIESINKEKEEQIKVIESLYQKQIDNCNKSISQLNDKLLQSLKENNISSDEESINKRIEKEKKKKLLEVENIKFKKEIEGIAHEKEELKKISLDKDKIIEKLEVEIEKYQY
jgi:hypothetical protein